jgi:hypothetical protein
MNLAFVCCKREAYELIYGFYARLERESAEIPLSFRRGTGFLFIEVEYLDLVVEAIKGVRL